ncbi:hypothetical protein [Candidatus Lokiarchaeum ossiferum]|uniref:hypothetical protein n=1 Tax=Candidatus Lokiarchaeum ossiferum TaxID=2951803 RepID=UPI00352D68C8
METKEKTLKVYKFQQKGWIQTEQLLNNDIAIVVDQTQNRIYFWSGKKSKPQAIEMAKKNLLIKKIQYSNYQYRNNQAEFPSPIMEEITKSLK